VKRKNIIKHISDWTNNFTGTSQIFLTCSKSVCVLALQSCVGLGFLHGFVTVHFCWVWVINPNAQSPTWRTRDYTSSDSYSLIMSGMGGRQHSSPVHWGAQTWRTRDYTSSDPYSLIMSGMGGRQHSSPVHWGAQTSSPR
jgi:hypothetical protein